MIITIFHSLSKVSIQSRRCTVHISNYQLHLYSLFGGLFNYFLHHMSPHCVQMCPDQTKVCLADEILATLLPIFQSIRENTGLATGGNVCTIGPRSRVSVVSLPCYNSLPRVFCVPRVLV